MIFSVVNIKRQELIVLNISVTDMALNWLIQGDTVSEISRAVSRSDKLIYHYRRRIMRALNIRNYGMDFIPSLSFSRRRIPTYA
ncbi:hypothetical protein DSC57_21640 [Salmonella enterica]|nr:hypothetical protein [Salmonella enterica]EBI5382671.1 hypothetical protein [Salmonella enterica]